jgi:hypothetical protein
MKGVPPEALGPARYLAASRRVADRGGLLACGDLAVALELGADEQVIQFAAQRRYRAAVRKLGL